MHQTVLSIRLTPGAKGGNTIQALHTLEGDTVRAIRISARPVDGQANKALIKQLSAWLSLPQSMITLISGATSRNKKVIIQSELMDSHTVMTTLASIVK